MTSRRSSPKCQGLPPFCNWLRFPICALWNGRNASQGSGANCFRTLGITRDLLSTGPSYHFILRQQWRMESPDLCMEGTPRSGWTLSAPTACVQYYSTATWQGKEGALDHVLDSPCSFLPRVKGKSLKSPGMHGLVHRKLHATPEH